MVTLTQADVYPKLSLLGAFGHSDDRRFDVKLSWVLPIGYPVYLEHFAAHFNHHRLLEATTVPLILTAVSVEALEESITG